MLAANWRPLHPVDIRLSLWLPFRRLYLTVIAGREKRDRARVAELRRRHPLRRLGHLLFIGAAAAGFYSLAPGGVLLLMSGVWEIGRGSCWAKCCTAGVLVGVSV